MSFAPSTRGRAKEPCPSMPIKPLDLPPLWSVPAPMGHNGGPSLLPRAPGRPSVSMPELCDRIFDLLMDGVPLRAIWGGRPISAKTYVSVLHAMSWVGLAAGYGIHTSRNFQ